MIRLTLLFTLLPSFLFADPVLIRSGEHAEFSRLVFSISEGTAWSVSSIDRGFRLNLDGEEDGFDLSQAFDRIPRDRIQELDQLSGGVLDIVSDCPCYVEAFLWRPNRIVLDVVDDTSPNSRQEIDVIGLSDPLLLFRQQATGSDVASLPDITTLPSGLTLTRLNANSQLGSQIGVANTAQSNESPEVDESAMSEAALLEGIARAASQGFLTPNEIRSSGAHSSEAEPTSVISSDNEAEENVEFGSSPGVDISTALESGLTDLGAAIRTSTEQRCLSTSFWNVASWGDERPLHDQVADIADDLAGDFGQDTAEAELDLARLYVHFGFGREAKTVLSLSSETNATRRILGELASLIDGEKSDYPLLSSQKQCSNGGEFWAFLANPYSLETDEQADFLVRLFFEQPDTLRRSLAPMVSEAFLSQGLNEEAELVLRRSYTTDTKNLTDIQDVNILIAEQNGELEDVIERLEDQAENNARMSPESAIRLLELTLEQGGVPDEASLILLSALGLEYGGDPVQTALADAEAKGWAVRGDFDNALRVSNHSNQQTFPTNDFVFTQLTESANASTFLEIVFAEEAREISAKTENSIASRLIELGFPSQALLYLEEPASRENAAERRYLRAKAALGIGEYQDALTYLQGMNDARSQDLRAAIHAELGDFGSALSALSAEAAREVPDFEFRAGAWERLAVTEDEALSSFARSLLSETEVDSFNSLEDRRNLLAQSEESRLAVRGLLERYNGTAPGSVSQ